MGEVRARRRVNRYYEFIDLYSFLYFNHDSLTIQRPLTIYVLFTVIMNSVELNQKIRHKFTNNLFSLKWTAGGRNGLSGHLVL